MRQRELAEEAGKAEAIEKADELRRSLLSAVSHDLRTPLAAAKAAVSSLRSDDVGFSEEDTAELLATVEESVDQLTALVDNLLDSSRLAAGVVRPELKRVYLEEVVQRALLSIGRGPPGSAAAGWTGSRSTSAMRWRWPTPACWNGYWPTSSTTPCATRRRASCGSTPAGSGDRMLINVIDEGPGVPRGAEDQMFEAFQRLGDRHNKYGVGLGLSVAKGFVEAMGGTISATDTPGGGLTVIVDLAAAARGTAVSKTQGAGDRRRAADPAGAADQPERARLRGDHRGHRCRRAEGRRRDSAPT